ncbi:glycoside hydrolase, partial [Meredithblackwellia eburnea MCA 4105]
KVRGVNLGSLFIVEPANYVLFQMGCTAYKSEWDCVKGLGKSKAQPAFEDHWNTFFNQSDFQAMVDLGLNTIRIPMGYWTVDSLIGDDYFCSGSMKYVQQICRWAKQAGLWIILDLHGAPGAQVDYQPFTGQYTKAGFYQESNYQKACQALSNWTTMVHTVDDFSNVVMIQVLNEPIQSKPDEIPGLLDSYYPAAQKAIRDAETALGVTRPCFKLVNAGLPIYWGSGDPTSKLSTTDHTVYEDHDYVTWITSDQSRKGYMSYSCSDGMRGETPIFYHINYSILTSKVQLSEFGLESSGAKQWYSQWASAQLTAYEKGAGWLFWSVSSLNCSFTMHMD